MLAEARYVDGYVVIDSYRPDTVGRDISTHEDDVREVNELATTLDKMFEAYQQKVKKLMESKGYEAAHEYWIRKRYDECVRCGYVIDDEAIVVEQKPHDIYICPHCATEIQRRY